MEAGFDTDRDFMLVGVEGNDFYFRRFLYGRHRGAGDASKWLFVFFANKSFDSFPGFCLSTLVSCADLLREQELFNLSNTDTKSSGSEHHHGLRIAASYCCNHLPVTTVHGHDIGWQRDPYVVCGQHPGWQCLGRNDREYGCRRRTLFAERVNDTWQPQRHGEAILRQHQSGSRRRGNGPPWRVHVPQ